MTERFIESNGVRLRVTEAGVRGAPVVVLAHGFPELAFSWRHQIPALAEAGYHVLAPDQRGYGGSSSPPAVEDYDIVALTGDLARLLDDVGAEKAVIVGHDWGSIVATNFPRFYPERVRAVVAMSAPPTPRASAPPIQLLRKNLGDNFFYILHYQEPGVADAELNRDPRESLLRMIAMEAFTAPLASLVGKPLPALPAWMTESELDHYVDAFTRTGFTGSLNWYRNFDRNWQLTDGAPAATISAPTLFIAGSEDPVLFFTPRHRVRKAVTGEYREVILEGAGHWVQQERPKEVTEALLQFLSELKT